MPRPELVHLRHLADMARRLRHDHQHRLERSCCPFRRNGSRRRVRAHSPWSDLRFLISIGSYIFMCPNCEGNGDPASVVSQVVNNLNGVPYGMMYEKQYLHGFLRDLTPSPNSWFDIEQCDGCWSDAGTNAQYMASAVNAAVGMGVHVGIYSSEYEWSATVGSYSGFTAYPLWYDEASFFSDCKIINDRLNDVGTLTMTATPRSPTAGPSTLAAGQALPSSSSTIRAPLASLPISTGMN